MNEDDPMLGDESQRQAYLQQINELIAQDVEQRRAQRLAEFQGTRDSKAVILGVTGTSDSDISAVS